MSKLIPLVVLDSILKILERRIPTAQYDPTELEAITMAQEVLEQLGPLTNTHIPENMGMRVTMEVVTWVKGLDLSQVLTVSGCFDRQAWEHLPGVMKPVHFTNMGRDLTEQMVEQLKNYNIL